MRYIYSAAITPLDDGSGYFARVPDLPGCITTSHTMEDVIDLITDAASLWLVSAEDHDEVIPSPTPQGDLTVEAQAIYTLIKVDTIAYRSETDTRAVRKNVSIPAWMATLADRKGINCSQVLQDALRARFDS